MKLIVGLGNPGLMYAGSRHNIGFQVIKSLASSLKISLKRDRLASALVGEGETFGENVILALPRTFMNLSGVAVGALLKKFKITSDNLLVICDDLDLDLGKMKIRPSGSSAGQRGIKSIIEHLETQNFSRLRIGIGRPKNREDAAKYVLSGFLRKERQIVSVMKEEAASCVLSWVEKGINETMNIYNTRSINE